MVHRTLIIVLIALFFGVYQSLTFTVHTTAMKALFIQMNQVYSIDETKKLQQSLNGDRLARSRYAEVALLQTLFAEIRRLHPEPAHVRTIVTQLLSGAYVQLPDEGILYQQLIHLFPGQLQARISSHVSVQQQYSLSGAVIHEVLLGVREDERGKLYTWIQFEAHGTHSANALAYHLIDYVNYKITGRNIGPYGHSPYTERRPLIL